VSPRLAAVLVAASLVGACFTKVVTDDDIFTPARIHPLDAGLEIQRVEIPVEPQVVLGGWWIDRNATQTILLLHDDGNLFGTIPVLNVLYRLNANLLAVDYRGYGYSSGRPSEEGLYRDVVAAFDFLAGGKGIPPPSIVVYGRRLGASLALELATARKPGGLILEGVFTSVAELFGFMDSQLPFYLSIEVEPDERFDNLDKAARCKVPVLVVNSLMSNSFRSHAEAVFARIASEDKKLVKIDGTIEDKPEEYQRLFAEFLGGLARQMPDDSNDGHDRRRGG